MLNISKIATFRRTVKVMTPDGDGHKEESVVATFQVVPATDAGKVNFFDSAETESFLRTVVTRLDDVVGATGEVQPYTEQLRDEVLSLPYVQTALVRTYFQEVSGAKAGN